MVPVVPACTIFAKLCTDSTLEDKSPLFINLDKISTGFAIFAMVMSVPLWLFIYNWLDQLMPGPYGKRLHPCFCCKKLNKVDKSKKEKKNYYETPMSIDIYNPEDPILVYDMVKKFGNLSAVSGISFSIKQDEIFTILGHNGAGKTTLINMITGMIEPTSGDTVVYGKSILDSIGLV